MTHLKKVWQTHNAKALPLAQLNFQGNHVLVNASTEEALLALTVSPIKHRGTILPWTTSMGIILPVVLIDIPHAVAPQHLVAAIRPHSQLTNLSQWVNDEGIPLGHWQCILHLKEGTSAPPQITLNGITEPIHLLAASNVHICAKCYTLMDHTKCTCSAFVTTPVDPTPTEQDDPSTMEHTPTQTEDLTILDQPTVPQDTTNTMEATLTPVPITNLDQGEDTKEGLEPAGPNVAPLLGDADPKGTITTTMDTNTGTPPLPSDDIAMDEDHISTPTTTTNPQPTPHRPLLRQPQKPDPHPYAACSKMHKKSNSIGASTTPPHLHAVSPSSSPPIPAPSLPWNKTPLLTNE
ncbi:hypothetical protein IWQ61_007935 [Dispira simplex]|nr:hypothetical protein IWQ61_007935 [Dispira simplex]